MSKHDQALSNLRENSNKFKHNSICLPEIITHQRHTIGKRSP
uniref:Uncharacterized protein n=1 Tax=Setaria italica TaxID=4555 RepID=K3XTW4_SETIT